MSLSRKHFQAIADALYWSRPGRYASVVAQNCADGMQVAWSQWRETRRQIETALRGFNPRFDRDRFEYWSEHGESEPTTRRRAAERKRRERT